MKAFPALVLIALAAAGCVSWKSRTVSLEEPVPIAMEGVHRHVPSGAEFPEAVGPFHRGDATRYDVDGLDVSVGYNLAEPGRVVVATVYVYPEPEISSFLGRKDYVADVRARLESENFLGARAAVLRKNEDSRLVSDESTTLVDPASPRVPPRRGRRAVFELHGALGIPGLPAESLLYQFPWRDGAWIVEYRFTYPAGSDVSATVDELLLGVPWPRRER
jgi:hypothetical protein